MNCKLEEIVNRLDSRRRYFFEVTLQIHLGHENNYDFYILLGGEMVVICIRNKERADKASNEGML
jgi:hypothetical protein